MENIAIVDSWIHAVRTIALGAVVFFCVVGLDLVLGAHGMKMLGKIFNRRIDLDSVVLMGLASLRKGTEHEIADMDKKILQTRARVFVGILLLIPAGLLITLVVTHR